MCQKFEVSNYMAKFAVKRMNVCYFSVERHVTFGVSLYRNQRPVTFISHLFCNLMLIVLSHTIYYTFFLIKNDINNEI